MNVNVLDFRESFHEHRTVMIATINRGTRPLSAADKLFEAIFRGELRPGEQIEAKMAKRLGVGQGTLREALQALGDSGLVTRRRTTVVTEQTLEDALILFAIWDRLEPMVAARACGRLTATHARQLERRLNRMQKAVAVRDFTSFLRHDLAFHHGIWKIRQTPTLSRVFRLVLPPLFVFLVRKYSKVLSQNPSQAEKTLKEQHEVHQELLAVLKGGAPGQVTKTFGKVIRSDWRTIWDLRTKPASTEVCQPPGESGLLDSHPAG
jgi:DNA-binding GntR family transcriptional regulator